MNVQYALKDGDIYVLEVNPRASRTVPFVAKVIGEPIAKIASRIMAGESLASFGLQPKALDHIGVKEAVFPFARFPGVDVLLGPEMRSTGEVIGLDRSFGVAFAKSQLGGGAKVPKSGTVFVSVRDDHKPRILDTMRMLADLGFRIVATSGTQRYLEEQRRPRRQDQQGAGRPAARGRRHQERRDPARVQHHRGQAGASRTPGRSAGRPSCIRCLITPR